jgi:hypothetical protein
MYSRIVPIRPASLNSIPTGGKQKEFMSSPKSLLTSVIATLLTLGVAAAQTSASSSASGNASVTPGQVSAGANTNQSVQAPGASANANASGQAQAQKQASSDQKTKQGNGANRSNNGSNASAGGASSTAATATASTMNNASAALSSGTVLQAELNKSVDARSAKAGDEVSAKLSQDVKSDGKVVLHKGTRLVGHVTQAQAHTKEHADSQLGIVFDHALLKGGEQLSFNGVISAVAPPVQSSLSAAADQSANLSAPAPMGGGAPARSSSGGLLGGATSTVTGATGGVGGAVNGTVGAGGGVTGAAGGVTSAAGGLTANGALTSASRGAIGLQGLTLNSATAGSAQGSIITSTTRNVKLESGTQMLLQVAGSAQ